MPELTLRAKPSDQIKIHNAWGGKTSEGGNYSIDSGLNMLMAFSLCRSLRTASLDAPPATRRNGFSLRRIFSFWKVSAAAPSPLCAETRDYSQCGKKPNQQGPVRNTRGQNKHAFAVTHMRAQNLPCRELIPNTHSRIGTNPLRINNSAFLKRFNSP